MVKQHIYRCVGGEYRTAALSPSLRESAWLPLLEQQMELHCAPRRSTAAYFQYPLGKGLVLSRCAIDPDGEGDTYIAHQLVFDSQEDIDRLMEARPVSPMVFVRRYPLEKGAEAGELPEIEVDALRRDNERDNGLEAIKALFGDRERLLAAFLAALSLAARDKRQTVCVAARELPDRLSEIAHRAMEMILSLLHPEEAMRLSYCTMRAADGAAVQYSAYFFAGEGTAPGGAGTILIDLAEGGIEVSRDVDLAVGERETTLAQALLSREEAGERQPGMEERRPEERAARGTAPEKKAPMSARAPKKRRVDLPAYVEGSSFRVWFEGWVEKLESHRSELTEEGFEALATEEWPRMLAGVVRASEEPENLGFLRDMNTVLLKIQRGKLPQPPENVLRDMNVLLLDSVNWRKVNLNRKKVADLMSQVGERAVELQGEAAQEGYAMAARAIYRLLMEPPNFPAMLEELALLSEKDPKRFEAVQLCLRRYVQGRMEARENAMDEAMAAAAMGSYVRFTDGVPDLRTADRIRDLLEEEGRQREAQQFQRLTDRMRRRLHAARPGGMQWHDVKVFLWISGALLALIAGITLWYLLYMR